MSLRAMRALCNNPQNRSMLIMAGAVEPLIDVLCGAKTESAQLAAYVVVDMTKVEGDLLANFNVSALAALLHTMKASPQPWTLMDALSVRSTVPWSITFWSSTSAKRACLNRIGFAIQSIEKDWACSRSFFYGRKRRGVNSLMTIVNSDLTQSQHSVNCCVARPGE